MSISIHRDSVVRPDGTIEVRVPELQPGQRVSITIESDQAGQATSAPTPQAAQRSTGGIHISDLIKDLPGHRLFQTAADVDDYLRQERESWDR